MKVIFPNPYGNSPASESQIASLKDAFGISEDYAQFLKEQNGFSFEKLEESEISKNYLTGEAESSEGKSDLRVLYSYGTEEPYYDVKEKIKEEFYTFGGAFFPVGEGYGGNLYVEILHGDRKGYVASLDHELYASSGSFDEFLEEFEISRTTNLSDLANKLVDEELGLAWFHAATFNDFISQSVRADEDMAGFAEDLESGA